MKKQYLLILLLLCNMLLSVHIAEASNYYVGSVNSDKYHYPDCRAARRIHDSNLISFDSAKEALDAGYMPCGICKPPAENDIDGADEAIEQTEVNSSEQFKAEKFKELVDKQIETKQQKTEQETSFIYKLTGYTTNDMRIMICNILEYIMLLSGACIVIISIRRLSKR